jgi:bacteriochlorophyll 4-vinyl reductase
MPEAGVGRVLVASLHQAIADALPMRLGFYEGWLTAEGLREGTIGVAAVSAVLSFLRREGRPYETVTGQAGEYAARWTIENMTPFRQRLVRRLPALLRRRLVVAMARRLVRQSWRQTSAQSRLRRGTAVLTLRSSIFCNVRERSPFPLCGFYAAATATLLREFGLPAQVAVSACRATGAEACLLTVGGPPA